jgi:site-specific recombinase
MTGATLAAAIGQSDGPSRLDELVTQVSRICRSQLAAALGNVTLVSVGAVGVDLLWRWRTGHPVLTPEKSEYVLKSLHPLASGTIFYAAVTGVILWLSSLAAGWAENFTVYRRLPQAIAEHGLGRVLGRPRMERLAARFARNVSGWSGSIALGFMLGMCPILGKFFGLPLDVRHVTLSTGTLALAAVEQGPAIFYQPAFRWAALGIVIIFVLNLSVSFNLALAVALRARAVPLRSRVMLASALLKRALRRPGQFIFPPGKHEQAPAREHH